MWGVYVLGSDPGRQVPLAGWMTRGIHRRAVRSLESAHEDSSVQFSHLVVSNSLRPHGPQHARPPCPSPTQSLLKLISIDLVMPSNHFILCHPLLLLPSIFPSIRVFSKSQLLTSGGQSIGVPASTSFLQCVSFNISPTLRTDLL